MKKIFMENKRTDFLRTSTVIAAAVLCMPLFAAPAKKNAAAQNTASAASQQTEASSSGEDEITLPEVTTVISGDALTAGKEAVPDYSKVLPSAETASVPVPVLPDVKPSERNNVSATASPASAEKDVYAEGEAGGGYPGYFTGDFAVYRALGDKPFSIRFSHESADGFGSESASDGYFLRSTAVSVTQAFIGSSARGDFSASYDTQNDGLQSQSVSFYDTTRHTLACSADGSWKLPHGFSLGTGADGGWYKRQSGIPVNAVSASDTENGASIIDFSPYAKSSWTLNGFSLGLMAQYKMQSNFGKDDALVAAGGSGSSQSTHRGEFTFNAGWKNDIVHLFGSSGIVCGTETGNPVVVVPWTIGSELSFATPASARPVTISAKGGVDSYQAKYRSLESEYLFSVLQSIPSETTDWYGTVTASVPVKDVFTVNGEASYRRTAFGNGIWEPLYSETSSAAGLYFYEQNERTSFDTKAGISAVIGMLTLGGSWNSYWLHVPASCDPQNFVASATLQPSDARWITGASCRFALGSSADKVPDISGNASVRLSPSIRLAVELDDIVKLVTNKTRAYAGTDYQTKSGHGVLLIKFQF